MLRFSTVPLQLLTGFLQHFLLRPHMKAASEHWHMLVYHVEMFCRPLQRQRQRRRAAPVDRAHRKCWGVSAVSKMQQFTHR